MIEVWKQMLEVLEYWDVHGGLHQPTEEAIEAGRKAIAELESQEPFGYVNRDELVEHMGLVSCGTIYKYPAEGRLALYTHPPQPAKPIPCANHCEATAFEIVIKNLQGEIERLKSPQRTEQESVADDFFRMIADRNPKPFPSPQRTWVGLTDDEYFALQMKIKTPMISVQDYIDAMRMVEQASKEKNA